MLKISFILLIAVALSAAEPPRYRTGRQQQLRRRSFLARQEAAAPPAPAPTGYPVAGITPETPFELPTATTAQPDNTYLPPDNTYGPPPAEPAPEVVYGPPETEDASLPENTYGPPAVEEPQAAEAEPEAAEPEVKQQTEDGEAEIEVEEEELLVTVAEDGSVISVSTAFDANGGAQQPARLVYQRFPQSRRQPAPVPARLTAAKPNFAYVRRPQAW